MTDTAGVAIVSHTGEFGATWTAGFGIGGAGAACISDVNRVRNNGPGASYYRAYASGVPAAADVLVRADFIRKSGAGTHESYIGGRWSITAETCYMAGNAGNATWYLFKVTSGTYTSLATVGGSLTADQVYKVELLLIGNTQAVFVDGVQILTASDGIVTGIGRMGFYTSADVQGSNANGVHLDNLQYLDLAAPPLPPFPQRRIFLPAYA